MRNLQTNGERTNIPEGTEACLTFAVAEEVASEIHTSLFLEDILRACRHLLHKYFMPARISLVQRRDTPAAVTVYLMGREENKPPVEPRVVALVRSRLSQCFELRKRLLVELPESSEQDSMEKMLLFRPETTSAVYQPLMFREKLKGILVLELPGDQRPGLCQLTFLDYLTRPLSIALENSDAHYRERRRGRQLAMVSEIARQAVRFEQLGDFLPSAVELLRQGFNYDAVQVWSVGTRQEDLRLRGFAHRAPIDRIIGASIPEAVQDCRRLDRSICNNNLLADGAESQGRHPVASRLAVPIRLRGKFLGVLLLESCRIDAFPPEDLAITEGVASLIASAFDHTHVLENAQQSDDYMQAILDSARDEAILSTDINGYVVMCSTGAESIFRLGRKDILGKDILTLFADEQFQTELAVYLASPIGGAFEKHMIRQSSAGVECCLDITIRSVNDAEKRPIGFLCIVRDVMETVRLQEKLETVSVTDELTGLFNQRHLFAALAVELERSIRYHRHLSLCFIDLDGFKEFNDGHGHILGDKALKEAAHLVSGMVRVGADTCFRYGGDEFVIVMPETNIRNAQNIAERLRSQISEHFEGAITASIGIAQADGPATAETLVDDADRAMYRSKSRGGNCITLAVQSQTERDGTGTP